MCVEIASFVSYKQKGKNRAAAANTGRLEPLSGGHACSMRRAPGRLKCRPMCQRVPDRCGRPRWDNAATARLRANFLLGAPVPDAATKHRSRQQATC